MGMIKQFYIYHSDPDIYRLLPFFSFPDDESSWTVKDSVLIRIDLLLEVVQLLVFWVWIKLKLNAQRHDKGVVSEIFAVLQINRQTTLEKEFKTFGTEF